MKETAEITKYDSGLSNEKHAAIAGQFNEKCGPLQDLIDKANAIKVTGAGDVAAMKLARTTRLSLKNIRVEVEKTRKSLKEESLREGKAIDGMANIVKFLIVPVEQGLQEKEDFVKLAESHRKVKENEARAVTSLADSGLRSIIADLESSIAKM